jgi:hypothetical protein
MRGTGSFDPGDYVDRVDKPTQFRNSKNSKDEIRKDENRVLDVTSSEKFTKAGRCRWTASNPCWG